MIDADLFHILDVYAQTSESHEPVSRCVFIHLPLTLDIDVTETTLIMVNNRHESSSLHDPFNDG